MYKAILYLSLTNIEIQFAAAKNESALRKEGAWVVNLRLSNGNTGVFPNGIQQSVQILFVGKPAYLLFAIVANHQIAQRAVDFPILEESLGHALQFQLADSQKPADAVQGMHHQIAGDNVRQCPDLLTAAVLFPPPCAGVECSALCDESRFGFRKGSIR